MPGRDAGGGGGKTAGTVKELKGLKVKKVKDDIAAN